MYGSGIRIRFFKSRSESGLEKILDPVCSERLDPDPDCPEGLDPDPVIIRPELKPWSRLLGSPDSISEKKNMYSLATLVFYILLSMTVSQLTAYRSSQLLKN